MRLTVKRAKNLGRLGVKMETFQLLVVKKINFKSYKLLVFGHRNLIKNITQTAVINILKTFIL